MGSSEITQRIVIDIWYLVNNRDPTAKFSMKVQSFSNQSTAFNSLNFQT